MSSWGGKCPRCGQIYRGRADGKTMGQHRTDLYAIGGKTREHCPYGGGTVADAVKGITPLTRRTQVFIVRVTGSRPLAAHRERWLKDRGLLEETLTMIREARGGVS